MKNALGTNIVKRRHDLKLTQAQVAEAADISINFLSKLERNHISQVSSDTLQHLAKALGTSMDSLVAGNNKHPDRGPAQTKLNDLLDSYPLTDRERLCRDFIDILTRH
ncbi:XRE family transcriptional regulator [Lactobacillus reuteri]|uniref:helix-turn-helix domain-containing protein n=1 Tax=Limosilactobacillus reuteri TaxID=1598 RepID=UPI00128B2B8C|nr:helix-turn-helix transcriptional regulator [Limosilactobacillus reuteri]MQB95682.1 XRE family transcriptional regulator [Limosilactobacillus reuteri]